jgi:DNA topoisomerase IA
MQSKAQNDEGVCAAENSKVNQLPQHLLSAAEGCRYLYLWLDCDREGENICFEVILILRSGKTQTHPHPSLSLSRIHTRTRTRTRIGSDLLATTV